MWNEFYIVGQHYPSLPFFKEKMDAGWLNYRIMYYREDRDDCDLECSLWLPTGFDIGEFESQLNKHAQSLL